MLAKGRAGAALLSGMRPDLGLFRDIRCAKAKRRRAGKFSASPRAECDAAMPASGRNRGRRLGVTLLWSGGRRGAGASGDPPAVPGPRGEVPGRCRVQICRGRPSSASSNVRARVGAFGSKIGSRANPADYSARSACTERCMVVSSPCCVLRRIRKPLGVFATARL